MKCIIAVILLFATTGSVAAKPGNNGDNGNHYAYGKEVNKVNQYGARQKTAAIPESSTLALIGLGLAGLIITRRRKK